MACLFLVSDCHQRGTHDPDLHAHVGRLVEGHSPGPYSPYSRRPGLLVSDVRSPTRMGGEQHPPPAGVQLGRHPPFVISHVLRCRCVVPNCNLDPHIDVANCASVGCRRSTQMGGAPNGIRYPQKQTKNPQNGNRSFARVHSAGSMLPPASLGQHGRRRSHWE